MSRPSSWMKTGHVRSTARPLPPRSSADVCVVGAGITGLTTAYCLAIAGARVAVLESGSIGSGETARTTAHLSTSLGDRYEVLARLHGIEGARLAARSHAEAIDRIQHIVEVEAIDCDFSRLDGYLHAGSFDTREALEREAAIARSAGLDVEVLEVAPGPSLGSGLCLRYARQGQLHPLRYVAGLVRAIERLGGRIYEGTPVERFEGGTPARAITRTGDVVEASALVVATSTPVNDAFVIHSQQTAMRTYVLGLGIAAGAIPSALHWDSERPQHQVRLDPRQRDDGRVTLIVSGCDHRTGREGVRPESHWDELEGWTRRVIPAAEEVLERWSAQRYEPADGLGFIGRTPSEHTGIFIATGDSGHPVTRGTVAAIMLSHLVAGRSHPWEELYDPRRVARGGHGVADVSVHCVPRYADWTRPPDVGSVEDIAPGAGAVVLTREGRVAMYRDPAGRCHARSATCTHFGGPLRWNSAENSWDCPLHGSRFDSEGRVINGPALHDLASVRGPSVGVGAPLRAADAGAALERSPSGITPLPPHESSG